MLAMNRFDAIVHEHLEYYSLAVIERLLAAAAQQVRESLLATCRRLVEEGKTIHIYGASRKGNAILQYAGIDSTLVPYAADRNPDKHGSATIGTRIPIISEETSRELHPDYYLALPWHFMDEFLDRESEFLDRGGQFIVPMPEVRILSRDRSLAVS
jgi:C-methyltransferase C-terminal domain